MDGSRLHYRPGAGLSGPRELSEALFAGDLVVYEGLAPFRELGERCRAIVATHLGSDAQSAEGRMEPGAFRSASVAARKAVAADPDIEALWHATLEVIGYDLSSVRFDRMLLRVAPSRPQSRGRFIRPLPAHRDSWGSAIMCQVNWWAPLFPLAKTRTMTIWPDAFTKPVANTSASWDFETLISGREPNYPTMPETNDPPEQPGLPVLIEPGNLLAFSAAHLHASVADQSGLSRLSLDTRTVWDEDIEAGRGAPNVDGAPAEPRWEMFERTKSDPIEGPSPPGGTS